MRMSTCDYRARQRRPLPFQILMLRQDLLQLVLELRILSPHTRRLFPKRIPLLTNVREIAETPRVFRLELLNDSSLADLDVLELFDEAS